MKKTFITYINHVAEFIAALMVAALFATFLLQIFSRNFMEQPYSWTLELCLTLWVWIVFFGNAFIVRQRDAVTFDIFYQAAGKKLRQIMALISAGAVTLAMLLTFLPTWDFINFLNIRNSASLHISMRSVFSIYMLFMIVVLIRSLWNFYTIIKQGAPPPPLMSLIETAKDTADNTEIKTTNKVAK
ncbi:MAG: TRAP transporter small permease subunit [Alphaproteobacteria bacterium]|nr:TRAP transporter small permease subunit [Alphaproteobacteria bacterium]